MKRNLIIICILCIPLMLFAQYHPDYLKDAEKAFHQKQYFEAAYFYQKYIDARKNKEIKNAPYVYYQLAESHRKYENYAAAKKWYKAVTETAMVKYPLALLWYGVCARATLEFDTAAVNLKKFADIYRGDEKYRQLATLELQNCAFAKDAYLQTPRKHIQKLNLNVAVNNAYALTKSSTGYLFTSAILTPGHKYLNRIYTYNGSVAAMVNLNWNDVADAEYGTATLTANGDRMYFTRWYKQKGIEEHAIYRIDLRNGKWTLPARLNNHVNVKGFVTIQPFVTSDGKRLFFSSDKKGGFGGQDIWVSDLGADGDALNSTNLGNVVNTAFDEQAPYYSDADKVLFYSSKGLVGMGGFDLFKSVNNIGGWSAPVNMGYPVNSVKDDIYYYQGGAKTPGFYISSDRDSECCLAIYQVTSPSQIIAGGIIDCDTQQPLAGVTVSLLERGTKRAIKTWVTTAGSYTIELNDSAGDELKLDKKGYITQNILLADLPVLRVDTLHNKDICLQRYKTGQSIELKNILFDFDEYTLKPQSVTVLDSLADILNANPAIHIKLAAHTDAKGDDAYNLQLSKNRAISCINYLVTRGIDVARLSSAGYGETSPAASNEQSNGKDNPAGRHLNRRVEFTIIKE